MPPAAILPKTLVRYRETSTRWYLAEALTIEDGVVTLQYLGKLREQVPLGDVECFATFLKERERVLSMDSASTGCRRR